MALARFSALPRVSFCCLRLSVFFRLFVRWLSISVSGVLILSAFIPSSTGLCTPHRG